MRNRRGICFLLLCLMILAGCNSASSNVIDITEDKAREMICERHATRHGTVYIISVEHKPDKYIIKWEIASIREGKDSINKESGEVKVFESSRGSCSWK